MPNPKAPAPYQQIEFGGGVTAPFYIAQFDKQGRAANPLTQRQMLDTAATKAFTDVFVFSHGWNNDWKGATKAYDAFIKGFANLRQTQGALGREYKPLLVGVFWPSTALVFPWESAPKMAAPDRERELDQEAAFEDVLGDLAADLPQADRFYELVSRESLDTEAEQKELAGMMATAYRTSSTDEVPGTGNGTPTADEVVALWRAQKNLEKDDDSGDGMPRPVTGQPGGLAVAGGVSLDARQIVRMFTVWKMKDRAGTVGFNGVASVLGELLQNSSARVHLVGHSFGAKVCLSALCAKPLPRPVDSVLLLQPAISALCFAERARDGKPGGYRDAFKRTKQPILSTFSKHDFPLTQAFHRAVRRAEDAGELKIAGAPSPFAALGGYGADGCAPGECEVVTLKRVADGGYALAKQNVRIYCLKGDDQIGDHGGVSNEGTWWALLQQVKED